MVTSNRGVEARERGILLKKKNHLGGATVEGSKGSPPYNRLPAGGVQPQLCVSHYRQKRHQSRHPAEDISGSRRGLGQGDRAGHDCTLLRRRH